MQHAAAYKEEIRQLVVFSQMVSADPSIPLRIKTERKSLDYASLTWRLGGLRTLVINGSGWRANTDDIVVDFTAPANYPYARPTILFKQPVPFHPHVGSNGSICWGNAAQDHSDWTLVDWLLAVVEFVQFSQNSLIGINVNSPLNSAAARMWASDQREIRRHVPPIDLPRLRTIASRIG